MMRHRDLPRALTTMRRIAYWHAQIRRELSRLSVYHPEVRASALCSADDFETLAFWLSECPPFEHRGSQ